MILENVKQNIKDNEYDAILLTGHENPMAQKNLRYLTGFTGSSAYTLVGEDFQYFISDFRYTEQVKLQVKGFEYIERTTTIVNVLKELIEKHNIKSIGFDKKILYAEYEMYNNGLECELIPLNNVMEDLRISKTNEEVEILKEACDIADKAFDFILTVIEPGMTEREVAIKLENHMVELGAEGASFDTIVASGYRGAMPHGVASDKVIEEGELVTLDFGCFYKGYSSDMTRTIAVGNVSDELKEIYEITLEAQKRGVAAAKAGMTGKELDAVCRDYITERGYGDRFNHGTGHGLGLEVHELPSVSKLNEKPLVEGACVTIEPGIYIPGLGGVRIEDDIVLTKDGCIVLNKSPKELIVL